MKIPVLLAGDGAEWEARVIEAFERDDLGVTVARRCVDVVELLALAASGLARAAVVSASLRRFDTDAVDRLLATGVRPVGVAPRDDVAAENRLRSLGVAHVVPDDAEPAVVATVVLDAVSRPTGEPSRRAFADPLAATVERAVGALGIDGVDGGAGSGTDRDTDRDTDSGADRDTDRDTDSGTDRDADAPDRRGSVIAVWGPAGAPGRSTIATTLADEISRLGASALLVDADVYGGVVAAMLGLLDESPGLAAACRAAGNSRLDRATLARLCWQVDTGLRVLTGIALPQRWPEIRATAIAPVLAAARSLADHTVVDCGFSLEADEEISFDTLAPRRNGATLAVLDAADLVLVVGTADPIGLQRLVRGLADLADAEVSTPLRIVVNKVRSTVGGRAAAAEVTGAVERFAGRAPDTLLPYDREAVDVALVKGRTLAQAAADSPLRRACTDMAREITGIRTRSDRHRRRR